MNFPDNSGDVIDTSESSAQGDTTFWQDPSLSSSQTDVTPSNQPDGSTTTVQSVLGAIIPLGYSIAGAVTGRPVTRNAQTGNYTIGNKPTVTGQIDVKTLALYGAIALVAVVVLLHH